MNPTEEPVPTPKPQISTAEFQKRQEELEKRARELDRREEELRNAPQNVRQNNWPPIPSFCPVRACFYQDINVDIPVEFQQIVKYVYYLWIAHTALRLSNVVIGLLSVFVGADSGFINLILALVYLVVFTPLSYLFWFR